MLVRALPEFADDVRQHRAEWPDDPMLYPLIGSLFDFAVSALRNPSERDGSGLARRVYEVVEAALSDGEPSVQDCFAIEMIESRSLATRIMSTIRIWKGSWDRRP